jgi:hypothetical protein
VLRDRVRRQAIGNARDLEPIDVPRPPHASPLPLLSLGQLVAFSMQTPAASGIPIGYAADDVRLGISLGEVDPHRVAEAPLVRLP